MAHLPGFDQTVIADEAFARNEFAPRRDCTADLVGRKRGEPARRFTAHCRPLPGTCKNALLSIEPLLEDLGPLDLTGIHWVIVGGESGPGARPMEKEWIISIRDQCKTAGVPFFFKQWGGTRKRKTGRSLDGRTYDEMPIERLRSVMDNDHRQTLLAEFADVR